MSRALVIGGSLLIGRRLVEQLLERGDDVVVMHRSSGTPFGARVGEIKCDRNDANAVRAALHGKRFDVVYDNVYDFTRGTSAAQVTASATAAIIGLRRYVFTSSVAVYAPGGPYDESAELVPSSYANRYGAQKADSERALFTLGRDRAIPVATIRPAFIYGRHNPYEREAFFWERLLVGRPILIPDEGQATMQWVYSQDVARASILAAEKDVAIGHAYNLANYPPITQIDFVRLLARVAGKTANIVPVPRDRLVRLGGNLYEPPYYFGAYLDVPPITAKADRVLTELGLELTSLEDGFRQTFEWFVRQSRPAPNFSWEDSVLSGAG
jgi:nucleoside-diphosphate-sugar epimerase